MFGRSLLAGAIGGLPSKGLTVSLACWAAKSLGFQYAHIEFSFSSFVLGLFLLCLHNSLTFFKIYDGDHLSSKWESALEGYINAHLRVSDTFLPHTFPDTSVQTDKQTKG